MKRLVQAEITLLRSGNIVNQNLLTFNPVKHGTTQLKYYLCGCGNILDVFFMYNKTSQHDMRLLFWNFRQGNVVVTLLA